MADSTNVFARNKVVGIESIYNCGNDTHTCRGPMAATPRNYTCVCPLSRTPHFTPPGNATCCATVVNNTYFAPNGTGGAVCPAESRVEAGSVTMPVPTTKGLVALARATLGMSRTLPRTAHLAAQPPAQQPQQPQ